jgi:hypothetical protein
MQLSIFVEIRGLLGWGVIRAPLGSSVLSPAHPKVSDTTVGQGNSYRGYSSAGMCVSVQIYCFHYILCRTYSIPHTVSRLMNIAANIYNTESL